MKLTRHFTVALRLSWALFLPFACAPPGAPEAKRRASSAAADTDADTLVVALENAPINLDPRVGADQASWRVHDVIYNGLLKNGTGGEFLPDLAESFESGDGRSWTFTLRPNVLFHDGRLLTSEDVAYTFESLLSKDFVSSKKRPLKIIGKIETPSPRTIVFHLERPYASFPLQLILGILPKGTTTAEAARHPIGTGPFRFVEAKTDDRVVFERFENHFRGPAKIPRLVYRIIPDTTTRALELLHGSVDLSINNLPPDLLPRLKKAPGLGVTVRPGANYAYVALNLRDPVLKDRRVRQALDLAVDRDALVQGLWRGMVEKTVTLIPPGHWARAELSPRTKDLHEARRLLDAAGFPDPGGGRPRLTLSYKTSTDEMSVLQATAIAEGWREIGVETRIRTNDFAVFFQDVTRGNFRLFSLRWTGIVDPDHFHEVFLSTSMPPDGWNRGFYSDPEVDLWIEEARTTLDRGTRRQLYERIQRRVAEDLPYLSLYTTRTVAVHAAGLTGLETIAPAADFTFLRNVSRPALGGR